MTKKADRRELLLEKIHHGMKTIHKKADRLVFCREIVEEAEQAGLENLVLLAQGYQDWLNEEYSGAIEKFELSLEIDGNSALPWHGLGNVYSDQEEYQQAEQAYRKAIELDKSFSYPWNGLGIIYRIRKDYDLSKDAYLKAIKIDETYADVHRNLGLCLWVSGNLEEALRYFETALSLYKDQGDDYRASIAEENLNSVQGEIEGKKALQAAKAQKRKNAKTPSIAY